MKQFLCFPVAACVLAVVTSMAGTPDIVPAPVKLEVQEGVFKLKEGTRIHADRRFLDTAEYLAETLRASTGLPFKPTAGKSSSGYILITAAGADDTLGDEGYVLSVSPQRVVVRALTNAGAFYAVQSLLQLLPPEVLSKAKVSGVMWEVPAVEIHDQPRFKWRGMMSDCGRHFFPIKDLKQMIDAMALMKLNTFHWHLTDDQGWRVQIDKYPKLTEVGAWRTTTPPYGNRSTDDGKRYGGFYSKKEIKELVAYAAERHITVVPEIEMPGHAAAAIAAYPELGNTDIPDYRPEVKTRWGVHRYIFAPKEQTFIFIEDVLSEVCELFPSKYIHIGGDEAPKDQWQESKFAQEVMKHEGLKDEHELQSWFICRVEKILSAKGRRLLGWDEIQEGGLSKTATMMVWRDAKWARHALSLGNDVVMATTSPTYFDYYQADPKKELAKGVEYECIGGRLELEKVYSYNPTFVVQKSEQEKQVIGTQFQLWSEYLKDIKKVQYCAFPRGVAMSEVSWTPLANKNYDNFRHRLETHLKRLNVMGINYRPLDPK